MKTLSHESMEVTCRGIKMPCIRGAALIVGLGLGFALGTIFGSQQLGSSQTQLAIGEVEWGLEGDMLTMLIPINNLGGFPATIQSISVRANTTDSTWYTDPNPASINNGGDTITGTSTDTFEWTPIRGSAPVDFLLPGNTYVIRIAVHDGDFEKTVTAQLEWDLRMRGLSVHCQVLQARTLASFFRPVRAHA